MLRFKYLRSDIGSFHIQVHISVIPLLLGFLLQFIKSIDTIFGFRSTGLRLTAHPFQLLTQQVIGSLYLRIHCLHTFLALLQVIAVVSFILEYLLTINFNDLTTYAIQEITIVCHHQDTDIGTAQVSFQPFSHFQIEVVGRLIEDDQFRVSDQDVGKCHPFQLSAGQMFHFLVEVCDLQL